MSNKYISRILDRADEYASRKKCEAIYCSVVNAYTEGAISERNMLTEWHDWTEAPPIDTKEMRWSEKVLVVIREKKPNGVYEDSHNVSKYDFKKRKWKRGSVIAWRRIW